MKNGGIPYALRDIMSFDDCIAFAIMTHMVANENYFINSINFMKFNNIFKMQEESIKKGPILHIFLN